MLAQMMLSGNNNKGTTNVETLDEALGRKMLFGPIPIPALLLLLLLLFLLWLFNFFFFRDRVSLYSPGCPVTDSVDQAGLLLTEICLPVVFLNPGIAPGKPSLGVPIFYFILFCP